jgi:DNA polymerase III subunit delta
MAYSYLLEREIREDNLSPCYVFYGEETYLADQFVDQVRSILLSPEGEPLHLERFDLAEARWAEILDVARTVPFFFAPWRILLVTGKEDSKNKSGQAEEKRDSKKKAADAEDRLIKEYCTSPALKTVLIVVIPGNVKKGSPQLKPFASLPAAVVVLKEMKRLKRKDLARWVEATIRPWRKPVTAEAQQRLVEIVGNDLRLLDNEIKKLFTYATDRRVIDVDDVVEVCDWGKEFAAWELVSALEKIDLGESLEVLTHLFRDGAAPEYVLGTLASLFRDALLARLWLGQGQKRQEIFQTLRPKVQEFFDGYQKIFRGFFELAEDTANDVLGWAIGELDRIDTLIKSSDVQAEAMISGFVVDYCRRRTRRGREATSGKRG